MSGNGCSQETTDRERTDHSDERRDSGWSPEADVGRTVLQRDRYPCRAANGCEDPRDKQDDESAKNFEPSSKLDISQNVPPRHVSSFARRAISVSALLTSRFSSNLQSSAPVRTMNLVRSETVPVPVTSCRSPGFSTTSLDAIRKSRGRSGRSRFDRLAYAATVGGDRRVGDVVGRIRRRLLVNEWVDPDEVLPHLPNGIRPHVGSNGGVIVGCCMIEIDSARPWPMPSPVGVGIRAAAHRISVEFGPEDQPTLAVWVPVRHTDSSAAVLAGGRLFPGVHARADVTIDADADHLTWSVTGGSHASGTFDIEACARLDCAHDASSEVADIVIRTALGLSPRRRPGRIEAVEMNPGDH